MTEPLAADLRDAVVRVCGDAFYYYSTLRPVFVGAGVSGDAFDAIRLDSNSKYVLCRRILAELDNRGDSGRKVQHAIVQQLLAIREPMAEAEDPEKGRQALADLRRLAKAARMPIGGDDEASAIAARRKRADLERTARDAIAARKADLQARFRAMSSVSGTKAIQERGYAFEEFLRDLFVSEDVPYRLPFRVGTVEQIDGAFTLDGHDYLVEAKWQKLAPSLSDLLVLAGKLANKYTDTRGFFITFTAPRPEVVDQLTKSAKSVLIMDGADLAVILEGRISLREALEQKLRKASQEGVIFYPLSASAAV
jgi:hypothetical protein